MVTIWEGALAPERYELVLSSSTEDGIDLSQVTASEFAVRSPTGTETTWAASHTFSADTQTLAVSHTFHPTVSELNAVGMWLVYARLTTPGGIARSRPRPIIVRARFDAVF
jgi:hypothetical protein